MQTNQEFKNAALSALKGNWAQAVLATIVYCVIVCIVSGATSIYQLYTQDVFALGGAVSPAAFGINGGSILLSVFVIIPLGVGFYYAFNALYAYSNGDVSPTASVTDSRFIGAQSAE